MTAATAPPARAGHPDHPARSQLRGDIEGLRAIAVLMVLAYHIGIPGSPGGFAGVDVFFVISGYLITNQLVREAQRDGRVSLPRFYARRARRLLPAASVVLITTTLLGWWLLPRGRHAELGIDVLGATGYVVNWVLAGREVDYLAEDSQPSLVQHYWSLSVEEQFYVVWPLLVIVVLWVARRYRLRLIPVLALVLGTLVAASLAWSIVSTASSPATAYFVTTTRAWQLGTGALLVLLTPLLTRVPRPVAAGLAWVGLGLIAVTLLVVDTSTPWPGNAALLPTLGTAAVIAAGIAWVDSPPARLLGVSGMRFLGGLSYSLYLWHWPALGFLTEVWPQAGLTARLAVGALSVLLAWATLRLVEDPIRFSPRLTRSPAPALKMAALTMATTGALALGLWLSAPSHQVQQLSAGSGALALVDPASRTSEELRMVASTADAVAHGTTMTPDPAVATEDISIAYKQGCQVNLSGTELKGEDQCWYGDPDGDVVVAVVGDSKIEQWSTAIDAIGKAEGWRVKVWTKSGCGFVDEGRSPECHTYNAELSTLLGEPRHTPDLILTSLGSGYGKVPVESMVRMLQPALDGGAEVVMINDTATPRPRGVPDKTPPYECLDTHRENYDACWSDDRVPAGTGLLTEVAQTLDAPFIDLQQWVCPDSEELGGCAPVVGGVVVNRQGSHLTDSYARSLTPILHHQLVQAGVAKTPLDQITWEAPGPATK